MRIIRLASLTVLALAIIGIAATANPYRVIHATPAYQSVPHVVQPRRVNVRIDVQQINPAFYASQYNPDGYDSADQARILAEIQRFSQQMFTLQAQAKQAAISPTASAAPVVVLPTAPPATRPALPPGAGNIIGNAVFQTKCASCHTSGKTAQGTTFVLLDVKGQLAPLTAVQKLNVIAKTYHQEMPPPSNIFSITPLTDAEFAALVGVLRP